MKRSAALWMILACVVRPLWGGDEPYKPYNNYDFVPGDQSVFYDDFTSDTDGEFPTFWKLDKGQGVVNIVKDYPAFVLTEGNYAIVTPRVKSESYLKENFTIEFDYFAVPGGGDGGPIVFLVLANGDDGRNISYSPTGEISTNGFSNNFSGRYAGNTDEFRGKWHHAAIAFKGQQLKCYVDQYRELLVPECGFTPVKVKFGGIAPLRFTNVSIANGGGMNLVEMLYKDGRYIAHGILFETGKATLKPSSMGTINQVVKALQQKPDLKLEISGHTDGTGKSDDNLKLSQSRADTVKATMVSLGIEGSRLTSKGYGSAKPVDDNRTVSGRANNRRVEFVKMK